MTTKLLDRMIKKIFPFLPLSELHQVRQQLVQLQTESIGSPRFVQGMQRIAGWVAQSVEETEAQRDGTRRNFICGKLFWFLRGFNKRLTENTVFVDVGGGNGVMLEEMRQALADQLSLPDGGAQLPRENFKCLETRTNWVETYAFDVPTVQYVFWEEEGFGAIRPQSVDVVLCMVSLHHMTDATIDRMLREILLMLKPDGLVLLKEHNCCNESVRRWIELEHWLYHIADCAYERQPMDAAEFRRKHVANYKSHRAWEMLFTRHGFDFCGRRNRFLDGFYHLGQNPSELYWDIYQVMA